MKKYLPIIPLVLWIFLYPMIGGIIYWQTNYSNALFVGFVGIIAIFNFVWYLAKLNYPKENLDLISVIGNLVIFNFPAYFLIMNYYKDQEKHRHHAKPVSQNLNYAVWELEELKQKRPAKYAKLFETQVQEQLVDLKLILKDQIYQGFGLFLLVEIYKQNSGLVDTFKIITLFKEGIEDKTKFSKNLAEFKKLDLNLFYSEQTLTQLDSDPVNQIYETLVKANAKDIYFVFKNNRVEMQQQAHNLFDQLS